MARGFAGGNYLFSCDVLMHSYARGNPGFCRGTYARFHVREWRNGYLFAWVFLMPTKRFSSPLLFIGPTCFPPITSPSPSVVGGVLSPASIFPTSLQHHLTHWVGTFHSNWSSSPHQPFFFLFFASVCPCKRENLGLLHYPSPPASRLSYIAIQTKVRGTRQTASKKAVHSP